MPTGNGIVLAMHVSVCGTKQPTITVNMVDLSRAITPNMVKAGGILTDRKCDHLGDSDKDDVYPQLLLFARVEIE